MHHDELTITLFVWSPNGKDADTIFEVHPFVTDGTNVKVFNVILTPDQYWDRLLKFIELYS